MNKKKTITKILPKIALLLAMVTILAVVLSGCGSQTVISTTTPEKGWAETEVNLTADSGFLNKILSWIGIFLGWITKVMPANSYILTLFIFAIIMEIILLPFSISQQKNTIKQSMLRPKEMAIRKKYAGRNDQATQQKMSQEVQELYQKENYNPMSGCLPLLIQLPIIMILYWLVIDPILYMFNGSAEFKNVLYAYITTATENGGLGLKLSSTNGSIEILSKINELGAEAFEGIKTFCANGEAVFAQIEDIAAQSLNFNIGPVNLGITPSFTPIDKAQYWLLAIPVLTFVSYFFSMRFSRKLSYQPGQDSGDKQMACSNKMMDFTMPAMSVWMTFVVPGAVGIYWIFKSVLGVVKQVIMSKAMPLPKFTEEDYKAAERELLGKQPKKVQKSENAGKVRSLHHIDDEDYDEHGNYVPQPEKVEEEAQDEKTAALPENNMTNGASLKDDSDKTEAGKKISFFGKKDKKD